MGDIWPARAEISKIFWFPSLRRTVARPCVGQPAEAFDAADMKEAKALLKELS